MTIYSLTASDEPLQVRYVGATAGDLEVRLTGHASDVRSARKWAWMQEVKARGAEVVIYSLSTHSFVEELVRAERRWIEFWGQYCDLFNLQRPVRIKVPRARPRYVRPAKAPRIVKPRSASWEFMAGIPDEVILRAIEAEQQYQARVRVTQTCDSVAQ